MITDCFWCQCLNMVLIIIDNKYKSFQSHLLTLLSMIAQAIKELPSGILID